jgi:hypothetical protein
MKRNVTIKIYMLMPFFLTAMSIQSCTENDSLIEPVDKAVALRNFESKMVQILPSVKSSLDKFNSNPNARVNAEIEILENFRPLLNDSKVLLESYDIDYKQSFDENDPRIVLAGFLIVSIEKRFESLQARNSDASGRIAQAEGSWWDCALEAVGVAAVSELIASFGSSAAVQASSSVILKAVGKVASRYAGWIGAAIMVADFTECMGYW